MKKEELIVKIMAILDGDEEPHIRTTKKGRPPKNYQGIPRKDILVPGIPTNPQHTWLPPSVYNASREDYQIRSQQTGFFMDAISKGKGREQTKVSGLVELHPEGWGYVSGQEENTAIGCYISDAAITKFDLRYADYIEGVATLNTYGTKSFLSDISTLNGQPVSYSRKTNFDKLNVCYPNKRVKLEATDAAFAKQSFVAPSGFGQRCVVYGPEKNVTTTLKQIAVAAAKQGIDVVYIALDKRPEDRFTFDSALNIKLVFRVFSEQSKPQLRAFEMEIERAKRKAEEGADAVVIVDGLMELLHLCDHLIEGDRREILGGMDYSVVTYIRKMLNCARNTTDAGSVTVIGGIATKNTDQLTQIVIHKLHRVANCMIALTAEGEGIESISLLDSENSNPESVLDEDELKKLNAFRREVKSKTEKEAQEIVKKYL